MGEPIHGMPQPPTADRGYEHNDVRIRPVAIFLAGLATMLVVVGVLMAGLFWWFEANATEEDPAPAPMAEEEPDTPGPLLQISPRQDLEHLRERGVAWLNTPNWVDKERGIARIPIDRAIVVTAERGLPEWPAVDAAGPPADAADRDARPSAAGTPEGSGQRTQVEEEGEQ